MAIITFLKPWATEILAVLIWTLLLWALSFLPDSWRMDKRISYKLKVRKSDCEIKVSIPVAPNLTIGDVQASLKEFFNKRTRDVTSSGSTITFYSQNSSAYYKIQLVEDDEEEKKFVTIKNASAFKIGLFGIKNLDDSLEEIQEIAILLDTKKKATEKVITTVTIIPRISKFFQSKLAGKFEIADKENTGTYYCSYTNTNIEVVSTGFPRVKKQIKSVVYDWMIHFI
jgi:hypothetical protein